MDNKDLQTALPALPPMGNEVAEAVKLQLQKEAETGNIEAIKTLREIQRHDRFNELVNNMDDDEFAL